MDSIAKANAALQDQINQKKNDSTINAMAAAKADSIEKANAANKAPEPGKTKTTKTTTHTTTTTKETTPPVTPAPTPAPSPVNVRPGANGPKSVNDRPGTH